MPTKCNNHPLWANCHRPPAPADGTSSPRWTVKRDAESDSQNSRGRRVAASRLPAAQPRRRLIPGVGDASEARGERGDFVKTLQCSDCSPGAHFPPQCPTNDMFVCNTICFLFLFPPLSPTSPSSSSPPSSSGGDTSKAPRGSSGRRNVLSFSLQPSLAVQIHEGRR